MFKSEDDMQEKLHTFLQEREKEKSNSKFHFYREVEMAASGMRPDIIGFSASETLCYELKLKYCSKIDQQGYNAYNRFHKAYVVLPPGEAEKLKAIKRDYGVMSFDGKKLKLIRGCKKKRQVPIKYGIWEAMNSVVRGFYLGGINERGREDRQGW